MNDKLLQAKIKQAEAKIRTMKIGRDAAYDALTAAQKSGARPDRRQRLADAYDRAEDKLEAAENAAREMKRKAMGLTPTVTGVVVDFTKPAPLSAAGRRAGWGHGSAAAPWAERMRQ